MSIKADVRELQSLQREAKHLRGKLKGLNSRMKDVEAKIHEYMKAKDMKGFKYNGMVIMAETKEKRKRKKKEDQRLDAVYVLEKYGVRDADKALEELMEARRGSPEETSKLKMSLLKNT